MKNQRKSLPESLSKQCSQKDCSDLAKNVPWNSPGLQKWDPRSLPGDPRWEPKSIKNQTFRHLGPPAAANRSQGCSVGGKPSKLDPKIIQNVSQNDAQDPKKSKDSYLLILVGPAPSIQPIFQQRERRRRQWA